MGRVSVAGVGEAERVHDDSVAEMAHVGQVAEATEAADVTEEPGDEEYRALAEFRYQIRRFLHFSENAARAAGLEPQHHQVLLAVRGLPDGQAATVGAVAERLQLQHHSVVELTHRLEERGLIARQRGEEDRRQVLITLTSDGERLLHDLSRHHVTELRSAGPALVRALSRVMRRTREGETAQG